MKILQALLLFVLTLSSEATFAADNPDTDAAPATRQPAADSDARADEGSAEPSESADIDAALAEEIRAAEAAQASAAPGSSDETFVPSVQISEDLSVSFPVDI